jgi:hypothetical protein
MAMRTFSILAKPDVTRIARGGYGSMGLGVSRRVGGYGLQEQVRGMKVRSSVKKLCEGCKVSDKFLFAVVEGGRRRVVLVGVDDGGWHGIEGDGWELGTHLRCCDAMRNGGRLFDG